MQYGTVMSDAKTAVDQAAVYAVDRGGYPRSLKALREAGYANVPDADPWGSPYVLAPVFTRAGKPQAGEDVYIYSKGPCGTGTYTPGAWKRERGAMRSGAHGAAGYSLIHGTFEGS